MYNFTLLGESPNVTCGEFYFEDIFGQLLHILPRMVRDTIDLVFVGIDLLRSPHPYPTLIIYPTLVVLSKGEGDQVGGKIVDFFGYKILEL